MSAEELHRLQERLGDALCAADPVAFWREHLPDQPLDDHGLRMAALLVAKLRFQRLTNVSTLANEWFAADPEAFAAAFREYHQRVPARSLDPWHEAEQFACWAREHHGREE